MCELSIGFCSITGLPLRDIPQIISEGSPFYADKSLRYATTRLSLQLFLYHPRCNLAPSKAPTQDSTISFPSIHKKESKQSPFIFIIIESIRLPYPMLAQRTPVSETGGTLMQTTVFFLFSPWPAVEKLCCFDLNSPSFSAF